MSASTIALEDVASDNTAGAHPAVLAAVVAANQGRVASYGDDALTTRASELLCERLGAVAAAPLLTGTAANVLSLELLVRPQEAVICARTAHIEVDECGAPERYLGCKLLTVDTPDGKLTPALLASRVRDIGDPHRVQARAVSISQPTELGTLYTRDELGALFATAREHGLSIHVDGARLPMAAAALGCTLAEAAGAPDVDVVSFGGTKCGGLAAEAVVVLRPGIADRLAYQRKQAMQLVSKSRFVAAQLVALLEDDLWRELGATSNTMAARIGAGLARVPGVEIALPVETNAVFARLAPAARDELARSYAFGIWEGGLARFMAAWDTTPSQADAFVERVRSATAVAARSA
ncbi:MAG TPA: beta-eliminating lyase-related protein [Gaiellales bacterium]